MSLGVNFSEFFSFIPSGRHLAEVPVAKVNIVSEGALFCVRVLYCYQAIYRFLPLLYIINKLLWDEVPTMVEIAIF